MCCNGIETLRAEAGVVSHREANVISTHNAPPSKRVVVIGFGSPIRGDDVIGPIVADHLRQQIDSPAVEVISCHVLTAELAHQLQDASLVLFLDASVDGPEGEIIEHHLQPNMGDPGPMAHTLDAPGLLGWTRALYGRVPEARLLTVRGTTFDYANYELSPQAEAMVQPMLTAAKRMIQQHLQ